MSIVLSNVPLSFPIELCRHIYNFVYGYNPEIHKPIQMARAGKLESILWIVEHKLWSSCELKIALAIASQFGHLEIVKYLIGKGVCYQDSLHTAAGNGHLDIIEYLVEIGVTSFQRNNLALRLAARDGHLDVIKFLVACNAFGQQIAVRIAADKGHLKVVQYLVNNGVFGSLLLSLENAAASGHFEIVEFLVNKGVSFQGNGERVLRIAAEGEFIKIVRFLVARGADLDGAFLWAKRMEDHKVVWFLIQYFPRLKHYF